MRLYRLVLFLLTASLACAAAIDGSWIAEMKAHKKAGSQERIVQVKFAIKSQGDIATGAVTSGARKRMVTSPIVDGKIEGSQFSFTTIQTTKKGEEKLEWRGTVNGDTLQGTRSRVGAKRGQDFTARRS